MIAPRLSLVLLLLFVTLPLATIAGVNRASTPIALLLIGFVLIVAAVDLALGLGRFRDLQFSLPETVWGIRDKRSELMVRAQFSGSRNGAVRLAVIFPDGLEPDSEQTTLPLGQ